MPAKYPVSLTWPEVIKVVKVVKVVKLVKLEQGSQPEEGREALWRACRIELTFGRLSLEVSHGKA